MATITIKIESEELAREVLTQLGYLPGDDDVPDLISVEGEEEPEPVAEEVRPTGKTHVAAIHERMLGLDLYTEDRLCGERRGPETPKQNAFCTTEDPKEEVEPVENEIGASLAVFSDETAKERDELYKQCMEVSKSTPSAEERLKATAAQLMGDELLNYLDAMCDHDNKKMREAAKAMVRKEFAGQTLKMLPALQKVLDDSL
jgi:hypothetical protein